MQTEGTLCLPSTITTRERYAFLKTKRLGTTWEENGLLYKKGPQGITVFDTSGWTGLQTISWKGKPPA